MDNRRLETVLHHLRGLITPATACSPTDGQLLERFVLQRDSAAFELLIRRHGPLVWSLCRRILGNDHDAEDAFQATFLVLVRRARSLDRTNTIVGWLHVVARRVALRARANANRRRAREMQAAHPESSVASESADLRDLVDVELSQLPEKYRLPLILCYLEGKTHEEAAHELHWPLGTLKCRVLRGRARLRQRLAGYGTALSACIAATLTDAARAAPVKLIDPTVRAALHYSSASLGKSATHVAATQAVSLAKEVLHSMTYVKLKTLAIAVSVLVVMTGAMGIGLHRDTANHLPQADYQRAAAADPVPSEASSKATRASSSSSSLDQEGLETLWTSLGSTDEATALHALFELASAPSKETMALLQRHLNPVKVDAKQIASWIADLDSDNFDTRQSANAALEYLGEYAVSHLERALANNPSLEAKNRMVQLLTQARSPAIPTGWQRSRRAIAILEHINNEDSRKLLQTVSQGRVKALPTQDAEAALDRLADDAHQADAAARWTDLSSKDETKALAALLALAASPKDTIPLLKKQLQIGADVPPPEDLAATPPPRLSGALNTRVTSLLKQINTPDAQAVLKELQDRKDQPAQIGQQTAFSPDGAMQAVGGNDGSISLIESKTGKIIAKGQYHKLAVNTVAYTPDGKVIAAGSADANVSLMDAQTGKLLRIMTADAAVVAVTISPDGKLLTTIDKNKTEHIWEIPTGAKIK